MLKFWISLAIGLFCILAWLGGRQEAGETQKWPSVPGVIADMTISESRDRDGTITHTAKVKYSYSVNGTQYEGDRIKVEASTDVSEAEQYPKGTPVTVFYNPAKPESSVLRQGGPGMLAWGIVGVGCLLYAAYALYVRRRLGGTSQKLAPSRPL